MIFYRYENMSFWVNDHHTEERILEERYYLVKETRCGWWVNAWSKKPRWISKTSRKKFAYPTKEEALESFKARKRRQISILRHRLLRTENALDIANEGDLSMARANTIPIDGEVLFLSK